MYMPTICYDFLAFWQTALPQRRITLHHMVYGVCESKITVN